MGVQAVSHGLGTMREEGCASLECGAGTGRLLQCALFATCELVRSSCRSLANKRTSRALMFYELLFLRRDVGDLCLAVFFLLTHALAMFVCS
jgi:hypothetical protein